MREGAVVIGVECTRCGAPRSAAHRPRCECGGLLDARYDLTRVRIGPGGVDPLVRFADLLPVHRIPSTLGGRITPLITAPRQVAAAFGVGALYLKWEGANPTGSTKDPVAVVALAELAERGVRSFAFSSTGNTAEAFARALPAWPELTGHLFLPSGFPAPPSRPANLVVHPVAGDYASAQAAAAASGLADEGGFFSVGRREGSKLAYLDALLDMPRNPTVIVQAVSSGMGIVAAAKAVRELRALGVLHGRPRLVAAQQESCAPMATAFAAGVPGLRDTDVVPHPHGRAIATLLGDPAKAYPYVREAVIDSGGAMPAVPDQEVLRALSVLSGLGVDACHSSATALGAVGTLASAGTVDPDDVVLVNLTGSRRSAAGRREVHEAEAA